MSLGAGEARFIVGGLSRERVWEKWSRMNERKRIPSLCSEDDAIVAMFGFFIS